MVPKYVDFSVGIERTAAGGYLVRAFSPGAEAESVTEFSFDPGGLTGVLESLEVGSVPGDVVRVSRPRSRLDFKELGRNLFSVLFPAQVGELYASEWSAAVKAGQGVRIRLHLRPANPELAWLTRIPWELIYDDRAGGFSCLNPLNPLIRHLDLTRPVERVPFRPPIRVLVAAANPSGFSELDLDGETERIEESRLVRVEVLKAAGPEDLRRELRRGRYQIIHFMGHGLTSSDNGSLVFSTPGGSPKLVTGMEMSQLVQGIPAAKLVILNACRSASAPKDQGADPLAGVAGALVRGGQPAVIGMQFAISDSAALTFTKTLYERLAEGDPIEAAVCEARLAIYLTDQCSADWFAPAFFLRGADRRIEEIEMTKKRAGKTVVAYKAGDVDVDGPIEVIGRRGDPNGDSDVKVEIGNTKAGAISIIGSDNRRRD